MEVVAELRFDSAYDRLVDITGVPEIPGRSQGGREGREGLGADFDRLAVSAAVAGPQPEAVAGIVGEAGDRVAGGIRASRTAVRNVGPRAPGPVADFHPVLECEVPRDGPGVGRHSSNTKLGASLAVTPVGAKGMASSSSMVSEAVARETSTSAPDVTPIARVLATVLVSSFTGVTVTVPVLVVAPEAMVSTVLELKV